MREPIAILLLFVLPFLSENFYCLSDAEGYESGLISSAFDRTDWRTFSESDLNQTNLSIKSIFLADTCSDPLSFSWVESLINNPFNPYCSECLRLYQADWKGVGVLIYEWDAGSCGFTDLGFTTIYNCDGDTLQHCTLSIAGLTCDPDAMITDDSLTDKQLIWQCEPPTFPKCPPSEEILTLAWVNDSLAKYEDLCDAICIEGNSGNYFYKHMVDTNVILELRTTCADIVRRFYNCDGDILFQCNSFSFGFPSDCTLPFLPGPDDGELLWSCPTTSTRSELKAGKSFTVFPTLTTDQVTLVSAHGGPIEISIFNAFGQILGSMTTFSSREIIPTQEWPVGTVFFKVTSKNVTEVFKIMKVQ